MHRPDTVRVRTLGSEDVRTLRGVLRVFADAFAEDTDVYVARPASDGYLERLLGSPGFVAVAAVTDGGEVVGGLTAYELQKPEQERSELYIYDLAVAESHRRQGIATSLIEEVKRIAAARGAWVIFVQADHGDDPAIALYSKLGEREYVMHFDIRPA